MRTIAHEDWMANRFAALLDECEPELDDTPPSEITSSNYKEDVIPENETVLDPSDFAGFQVTKNKKKKKIRRHRR